MHPRVTRREMLGRSGVLLLATGLFVQGCGSAGATPTVAPTVAAPPTLAPRPTVAPPTVAKPAISTPTVVPSTPTPAPQGMTSPDYGIQVFLWGSGNASRDLGLAKEGGFRWIKQSIEWRYVEPHQKGQLEFNEPDRLIGLIESANLKLLARIDNQPVWARSDKVWPVDGPPDKIQDFADFLHALATRYKGKIAAYEIWNEPNLAREWGNQPPDPKQYVELLKAGYEAIKAADPQADVISAGLSPTTASGAIAMPDIEFIQQIYKAGGAKYFDLLGAHAAGYKAPPDMSPDDVAKNPAYNHGEGSAGRIYCFRHVEDVRKVMEQNGDSSKRIAVLEFGWTTDHRSGSPYLWHAVSDQQQADYLVGAYQWAKAHWQPWISVMSAIYIAAPYWTKDDEEYYWAITNPDGTVRTAYRALASMPK
ncbi:MAG: hypothetical protein ACRDIY_19525 [Chloroflexota bacterium]